MKNQVLRKKILAAQPKILSAFPAEVLSHQNTATQFTFFFMDVFHSAFEPAFNKHWKHVKSYLKHTKNLWGIGIKEIEYKKIFEEILFEHFRYMYYGKLFEMARENFFDDDLEASIIYDKSVNIFRSTKNLKSISLMIEQILYMQYSMILIVEGKVSQLENRYGYPKIIYKKAYQIQEEAKQVRTKITNENAVLKANDICKVFPALDLMTKDGEPTEKLMNIAKAYSAYKTKIKKELE